MTVCVIQCQGEKGDNGSRGMTGDDGPTGPPGDDVRKTLPFI